MRTRVKICGITQVADAVSAAKAGADAIGLVFYANSPRAVTDQQALDIAQALPPFVTLTALFVNPSVEHVNRVLTMVPVDLLQFHGDESVAFCEQFKQPYMKAIRVREAQDIQQGAEAYPSAKALLLDAYQANSYGGTGHSFNWQWVTGDLALPVVLAGGLTPDNVVDAISSIKPKPYAVDVSSGVEASKGIKDHHKIAKIIERVTQC